jgi:hypothetical protein
MRIDRCGDLFSSAESKQSYLLWCWQQRHLKHSRVFYAKDNSITIFIKVLVKYFYNL